MIIGWEWLWNRTKRLANLLLEPRILDGAIQLVEHMDRWCEHNGVPEDKVGIGDAIFPKGLCYISYPLIRE